MAKTRFLNHEQAFTTWIRVHSEDGYLLNCIKAAGAAEGWPYMLHRADCIKFTVLNRRSGKNFTTRKYYKVCSTSMNEFSSWAKRRRGDMVPKCKICL